MMAGFQQFFTIFFMEFIILGQCILGGGWEGHGVGWVGGARGGVGGGKSLNKEEIRHKE